VIDELVPGQLVKNSSHPVSLLAKIGFFKQSLTLKLVVLYQCKS